MSFERFHKAEEESELKMQANSRLFLCAFLIVGSAIYGVIIVYNPRIASAIMLGYIAVVLTIFAVTEMWKKPPSDVKKSPDG